MDNNFQTSFIPKKALAEDRVTVPHHTSIFSFVATLVFFAALASAAGMYFYKASLTKSLASMSASLTAAQNEFEPSFITQLQTLDHRITDANTLLSNHIVVTPIFAALEKDTLKSVQYTKFSYVVPDDPTQPVVIDMSGVARDYTSIALESDMLTADKEIQNPLFSNLALDEQAGTVSFDLTFSVSPDLVRFTSHLSDFAPAGSASSPQAGSAPASSTPTGTPSAPTAATTNSTPPATGTQPPANPFAVPGQ